MFYKITSAFLAVCTSLLLLYITFEDTKIIVMTSTIRIVRVETCPFQIEKALNIAWCESNFDPFAKNNSSTASGLFQFLDSTWEENCEGDKFNYRDSIKCFVKLYPQHPSWWECKG